MHFAARRVVVDDAPRELVDMEAQFPVATEAEQQQQQPEEREVSLASRSSGSRSSAVRSQTQNYKVLVVCELYHVVLVLR